MLLGAGPAPQDHPVLSPTRDALVGYHLVPGSGEPIDVRVVFRAGGKALRVDLPDTSYVLAFPPVHEVTMVVPLQRTTADLDWTEGPQSLFLLNESMKFTRKAEMTVAGQKCTQWEAVLDQDRHTVCVTADGILLRNQSQDPRGHRNLVEAFAIRYESVPNIAFELPADFERVVPGAAR